MEIRVNGKSVAVDRPESVEELVRRLSVKPDSVVIEYNGTVLSRADWTGIALKDEDSLEIVSFVGGG